MKFQLLETSNPRSSGQPSTSSWSEILSNINDGQIDHVFPFPFSLWKRKLGYKTLASRSGRRFCQSPKQWEFSSWSPVSFVKVSWLSELDLSECVFFKFSWANSQHEINQEIFTVLRPNPAVPFTWRFLVGQPTQVEENGPITAFRVNAIFRIVLSRKQWTARLKSTTKYCLSCTHRTTEHHVP